MPDPPQHASPASACTILGLASSCKAQPMSGSRLSGSARPGRGPRQLREHLQHHQPRFCGAADSGARTESLAMSRAAGGALTRMWADVAGPAGRVTRCTQAQTAAAETLCGRTLRHQPGPHLPGHLPDLMPGVSQHACRGGRLLSLCTRGLLRFRRRQCHWLQGAAGSLS